MCSGALVGPLAHGRFWTSQPRPRTRAGPAQCPSERRRTGIFGLFVNGLMPSGRTSDQTDIEGFWASSKHPKASDKALHAFGACCVTSCL